MFNTHKNVATDATLTTQNIANLFLFIKVSGNPLDEKKLLTTKFAILSINVGCYVCVSYIATLAMLCVLRVATVATFN